jgi:1-deoxy-D-xylulose-5-phosphate reductoisomerase
MAQLARPDMRLPIQFALSYPERLPRPEPAVDLAAVGALHFEPLSPERWPCLALAREAMARGGAAPAVLNAADEVAVEWFLAGQVAFTQIPRIVEAALRECEAGPGASIEDLLAADRSVRERLQRDRERWS